MSGYLASNLSMTSCWSFARVSDPHQLNRIVTGPSAPVSLAPQAAIGRASMAAANAAAILVVRMFTQILL